MSISVETKKKCESIPLCLKVKFEFILLAQSC